MKSMVLLVTEGWWPAGKSEEVGKLYLEIMKKYPRDKTITKSIVPGAFWAVKEGMHVITVTSIKPGKFKEAMDITTKRLLMMASIEGYRYQINIAYDLVEAMPLVGLKAPE
jgi:hypothetical protein